MITSSANPRVKEVRKLQRRRGRYTARQIFIEGVRLLRDAWDAGARPVTVFYAPELLTGNDDGQYLLDLFQSAGIDCLSCTQAIFALLSETISPQGIGAVVPMPLVTVAKQPYLALVLDQVRDPGNAGTLLRTGEAAGVDLVIIAPGTVDPFNDKAVRAGMGAHFRLPVLVAESWRDVEVQLSSMQLFVAELGAVIAYDEVDWRKPSALIVGGEAHGSSADAQRNARPIAIPMLGATESLNAAVAGAIILFEAARQRRMS